MRRQLATTIALVSLLATGTACSGDSEKQAAPKTIEASALQGAMLPAGDIDAVMGTKGLEVSGQIDAVSDNGNLMPNENCLGIWQVAEKRIYDNTGLTAVRGQVLRTPKEGMWDAFVQEAVVIYPNADAAKKFLEASAGRWSQCKNRTVNLTINDVKTTWFFADSTKTDTRLTAQMTRNGAERSCQRSLSVVENAVVEVSACKPGATDQAAQIADKVEAKLKG